MPQNETPRMLKAADAARCIGITKSTVYDWIARGYIPCHRFGRTIRISKDDLEAYLARSHMNDLATTKEFEAQRGLDIHPDTARLDDTGSEDLRWEGAGTMSNPPLPPYLVESFKKAYREAYGHEVPDGRAEELAWYVLDVMGPILKLRARALQKRRALVRGPAQVDQVHAER